MTTRQRLELRSSEIRERLNEIAGLSQDQLTDEIRSETDSLTTEYRSVETKLRAAIVAEDGNGDPTETARESSERRELRRLIGSASLSGIADAVLGQRPTEGAELEVQQHFGLQPNQVPMAMLQGQADELETRAVTPAPSDVGTTQATIIPYVFPKSCHAYLGVATPTVPVGERSFPVLTTPAAPATPAKDAGVTETTGAFSASVLSPGRIQASFLFRREDLATFAGMEEALRMNLSDALGDALDKAVIGKFFASSGGLANPTDPTTEATFDTYRTTLFGGIDGRYAHMAGDIRWLTNADVYAHMAGKFRATTADVSALDSIMRVSGGVRVSAHIPAKASNVSGFLSAKAGGRGMNAVAPVWDGVTLIRDEYTQAAKGQIVLTAVLLHAVAILRADGFQRLEVHTG